MTDTQNSSSSIFGGMMEDLKVLGHLLFAGSSSNARNNSEHDKLQEDLRDISQHYAKTGVLDRKALIQTGRAIAEQLISENSTIKALEAFEDIAERGGKAGPIERQKLVDYEMHVVGEAIYKDPQIAAILDKLPPDERFNLVATIISPIAGREANHEKLIPNCRRTKDTPPRER